MSIIESYLDTAEIEANLPQMDISDIDAVLLSCDHDNNASINLNNDFHSNTQSHVIQQNPSFEVGSMGNPASHYKVASSQANSPSTVPVCQAINNSYLHVLLSNENSGSGSEKGVSNQRSSLKWEKDEMLGSMATISPVLYANINHPYLRQSIPNAYERVKQMAKLWRSVPSDARIPFLQKARENRSTLRIQKTQEKLFEFAGKSPEEGAQQREGNLASPILQASTAEVATTVISMPNNDNPKNSSVDNTSEVECCFISNNASITGNYAADDPMLISHNQRNFYANKVKKEQELERQWKLFRQQKFYKNVNFYANNPLNNTGGSIINNNNNGSPQEAMPYSFQPPSYIHVLPSNSTSFNSPAAQPFDSYHAGMQQVPLIQQQFPSTPSPPPNPYQMEPSLQSLASDSRSHLLINTSLDQATSHMHPPPPSSSSGASLPKYSEIDHL